MKKIAFIGGYDKADIILYVSKILSIIGKKVLVVDTTLIQKTKYIIPTMTPVAKYVTTYDGIDVAIGFNDMTDLGEYFGFTKPEDFNYYDFIIYDIDNPNYYDSFKIGPR